MLELSMLKEFSINILRWGVLIFGILDAYKYKYMADKIVRLKSSKGTSRKFLNISIVYRILLFLYSFYILNDWSIFWGCVIALFTLSEVYYYGYIHYPYKYRGLRNFRRPPLLKYIWNSIVPNKYAKRL